MYRTVIEQLAKWKQSPSRKPLIINGARQVGNTYILREFGAKYYQSVAYVNLDHNGEMEQIFIRTTTSPVF